MRWITLILANALALFFTSWLLPGFDFGPSWLGPAIAGIVITVLNLLVKPLLQLLSFPLIFFSAGLFLVIINAFIIFLTQYLLQVMEIDGVTLHVSTWLTYLWASLIFGLANWLIHWFIKD